MSIIRNYLVLSAAIIFAAGIAYGAEKPSEYIGQGQCKVCHNKKTTGAQWAVWKEMKHAHAFDALKSDEAKEMAKELGLTKPPHEEPQCVKCHVTGYDLEKMTVPAKIKLADSVQCETCHGPGSAHKEDGRAVMFKKKTADEVDWMANLVEVEESICLKCHNEESPAWNPEQFTLEDGTKVGFDFKHAAKIIAHPDPTHEK